MADDLLVLTYEPVRAPPRRVRYEPRSDGRYARIEQEWTGCVWRETGREVVDDVTVVAHDC